MISWPTALREELAHNMVRIRAEHVRTVGWCWRWSCECGQYGPMRSARMSRRAWRYALDGGRVHAQAHREGWALRD